MRSSKAMLGIAVMAFMLSGCGGGSGASTGSAPSASGLSSTVASSGSGSGSVSSGGGSGTSAGSGTSSGTGSGSGSGTTSSTIGSATLRWQAPTTNTNGTALTDLAGFYIYYGSSLGSMTNRINVSNPSAVSYVISNLSAGTWYFGIVAYTNIGLQSLMSNVGSKTIT